MELGAGSLPREGRPRVGLRRQGSFFGLWRGVQHLVGHRPLERWHTRVPVWLLRRLLNEIEVLLHLVYSRETGRRFEDVVDSGGLVRAEEATRNSLKDVSSRAGVVPAHTAPCWGAPVHPDARTLSRTQGRGFDHAADASAHRGIACRFQFHANGTGVHGSFTDDVANRSGAQKTIGDSGWCAGRIGPSPASRRQGKRERCGAGYVDEWVCFVERVAAADGRRAT
mmetsp:Transcript_120375/g.340609  ORF Transcript_120375/g.340609 Transcript_120375/m.340609 type:complete len:225 (+) Transcript_120375:707-1381(+)